MERGKKDKVVAIMVQLTFLTSPSSANLPDALLFVIVLTVLTIRD